MSTETLTATDTDLKLTPPDPVPPVAAERAAGLVPVADEVEAKLDEKVEGYICRSARAGCQQPRIWQARRSVDQYGPQGNHGSRGAIEPFPRSPDPSDGR